MFFANLVGIPSFFNFSAKGSFLADFIIARRIPSVNRFALLITWKRGGCRGMG